MKRTYQPNKRKRAKTHGFRARMATKGGRAVLSRRRAKGRKQLTVLETIKSKREFEKVFSGGKRVNHRLVRACVLRTDEGGFGKVAFVAPKRLGNAVYRNRCKRVLREAARLSGFPLEGADVILLATRQTHESHPSEVGRAIASLIERVGV